MAVRGSMANLILRVRLLTNDVLPPGSGQIFADQDVQNVMDETRLDLINTALQARPTYTGSTIQYLDYFADPGFGNWEDDLVLKQYLTQVVSPSVAENIVGHWTFATNTYPPVYITGKTYDVYRSAADLLERWAAKWTLAYDFTSDSQSFHRSQAVAQLQKLAHTHRLKQRPGSSSMARSDLASGSGSKPSLKATAIDYFAKG